MSGEPAPRLLVVDGGEVHDVLEVLAVADGVAHVRSPLLFEIGEQLTVRIEHGGATTEVTARVRTHDGPTTEGTGRVTELELLGTTTGDAP